MGGGVDVSPLGFIVASTQDGKIDVWDFDGKVRADRLDLKGKVGAWSPAACERGFLIGTKASSVLRFSLTP